MVVFSLIAPPYIEPHIASRWQIAPALHQSPLDSEHVLVFNLSAARVVVMEPEQPMPFWMGLPNPGRSMRPQMQPTRRST